MGLFAGVAPLALINFASQAQEKPAVILLNPLEVHGTRESAVGPVDGFAARRSATGTKTDTPLIETPQSVSVVPATEVRAKGAQSVSQALRYTPGLFTEPNGESSHYDELRVRGFNPLAYQDGTVLPLLQWWGTPRTETYGLERIEVLKGPGSVLFGQNSPGGLVNFVSKRPTDTAFGEVELQTGSHARRQGAFDVGGPLDREKTFLYRLTGLGRLSDTAVDKAEDKRLFIAPAFTWRPGEGTELTILGQYARDGGTFAHQYLPAQGTIHGNPNGRISRHTYVGDEDFDNFDRTQASIGYQFQHRFDDIWTVRQNVRYMGVSADFRGLRGEGLQDDLRTLNRGAYHLTAKARTLTVDNQVQAEFSTGPLAHQLLVGLDYQRLRGTYVFDGNFSVAPTDIYNPVYGNLGAIAFLPFSSLRQGLDQTGIYVQDQVRFGKWIATLGGRFDWAETDTDNRLTGGSVRQSDHDFTYRAGLSYQFDSGFAPYVAYSTSFQVNLNDGSAQKFKPTTGKQIEAGIKYQPPGMNAMFTAAVFDLTQENAVTSDLNFVSFQSGKAKVRGFELEAKGRITTDLSFTAGYALLDSEITHSANPYELGRPLHMTPRHSASLWLDYSLPASVVPGLTLGGGVRYVGTTISETTSPDPVDVPARTLVDAALTYDLGALSPRMEGAQVALNVTNLFDKKHVTYCYGTAYCSYGAGRMALATVRYSW